MRKILLLSLALIALASCKKEPPDVGSDKMYMITKKSGIVRIYIAGSGYASIDWGDGSIAKYISVGSSAGYIDHAYTGMVACTITITSKNVTSLECPNNNLINLDVSENKVLKVLYCHDNELASLNVNSNTALTSLNCSDNKFRYLDVSRNTALTFLDCNNNELESLDVQNNTALRNLYCNSNQMEAPALVSLLGALHSNKFESEKQVWIIDNPGLLDYDGISAAVANAQAKGWTVFRN